MSDEFIGCSLAVNKFMNKMEEAEHTSLGMAEAFDALIDPTMPEEMQTKFRSIQHALRDSYLDPSLQIHNFKYFTELTDDLIRKGKIGAYMACRISLVHFHMVNKEIGMEMGTEVMKNFVKAIESCLQEDEEICRVGGDHFIVLFKNESLERITEYLIGYDVPYGSEGDTMRIVARAGFYDIPKDCRESLVIIERVNRALESVKEHPGEMYRFFDREMERAQLEVERVEDLFQEAIDNEEFLVYYQPKVDLHDYHLYGAEALCRWKHDGELIAPYRFIPIYEKSNNICTLDFYMLEHVCRDLRRWMDEGRTPVRISVNLSRRNMDRSHGLADRLLAVIDKYEIPHEYLEVELTETTTDVDFTDLKRVVSELHVNGIHTSVDDFGVGYSSLNLIRDLPWNLLKLDKSFLPEEGDTNKEEKIIMFSHVVAMAKHLGLTCLVEGVETLDHVRLLKENNCFIAQGYYFDKPLPREQFEMRLE
ncbi:MAG: bifunctional diguanylate cyclase/phosphodiesterase [Lachnospiraceae bacterium]|nr:bifunctional diguanylate cyclase/phosphodiesterase [Lachnospiraceae bacterium]